ncbi:MAG: MCE family protein [Deltaproteobacteria bacterium]|uniref:MCE family protein n=1 Tax=Candidatus Zymogenus saltonus TaxID=2844893 RepID=A0A9D8K9E7_9DELT|nr:MCE family protein [Candidatus Zymogenus saltonus]
MDSKYTEIKVGIFVIVGIAILTVITLFVGEYKFKVRKGYALDAEFKNVAGLDMNGPVRLAGVEVGSVTDIGLTTDGKKAKITMDIDPDVEIYRDAKVELKSYGALGEKFVMIYPGNPDTGRLESGETITDVIPEVDLNDVMRNVQEISDDIKDMSGNLSDVLGSDETKKDLKEIIANIKSSTENLSNITTKLNSGNGTIGKLINDDTIYNDVKTSTKALKDVADKMEKGEGTLGRLAHDETLYVEAENAMREFRKSAEGIQEQTPISVMATIFGLIF